MRALTASVPGYDNGPNEDWVATTSDLVVVLDGATSRTATGCIHGVAWFTNKLGAAILDEAADHCLPIDEALGRAIERVAMLHPDCDTDHPGAPSAAVGIVRQENDHLNLLVLADISIALHRRRRPEIQIITDQRPDAVIHDQLVAALALPTDDPSRDHELRQVKRTQQSYRNQVGGYFVASGDPTVIGQARTVRSPLCDIRSGAVLSDGATRAVSMFGLMSWSTLFDQLHTAGPECIVNAVRATEATDPRAKRWPRAKISDDATIAYVQF